MSANHAPARSLIIAAFAVIYLVWGSTYLAIRFAIETLPPFLMAGSRFFVAGLIMLAISQRRAPGRPTTLEWKNGAVIGACLLLGGNGGVTFAEQFISSGLAALLVATVPLFMALLGWAAGLSPRPTPKTLPSNAEFAEHAENYQNNSSILSQISSALSALNS